MIKILSKRAISVLISIMLITAFSLQVIASYNGNSTPTYNSGTTSNLKWTSNSVNQALRVSIMFIANPTINTMSKEERDAFWETNNNLIRSIGDTTDVYRSDTQDIGTFYMQGNIFINDLVKWAERDDLYSSEINKRISISAKDITGMNDTNFPKPINSGTGGNINPGLSTIDYFMVNNPKYRAEGNEAQYLVGENMKALIHYVSDPKYGGKLSNGKDVISFISEKGTPSYNDTSVFDEGKFENNIGEYRVIIEPVIIATNPEIGSVAFSLRDAIWDNDTYGTLLNSQGVRFRQVANDVTLTGNDMFGLQAPVETITTNESLRRLVTQGYGYGLNILSSELFRSNSIRSMATQVTSILNATTSNSGGIEFIGSDGASSRSVNAVVNTVEKVLCSMVEQLVKYRESKSIRDIKVDTKELGNELTEEQLNAVYYLM